MRSLKLTVLALSLIGIFGAGNTLAADTATINASATVLGTCTFDVATYDLAFGVIDQTTLGAADVTATANLEFTCSNGTVWTLDDETLSAVGAKSMSGAVTAGSLAYQIDDDYTFTGTGTGLTQTVTVAGTILNADAAGAAADVYTDSFTIDINP